MKKKYIFIISFVMFIFLFLIFSDNFIINGFNIYKEKSNDDVFFEKINEVKKKEGYIKYEDINPFIIEYLLSKEDKRFYFHFGIDPLSILRATYNNFKAKKIVEGGSTITQQLSRNLYLNFEKTLERKVAEAFIALKLEKELTKKEILELYLNVVYFGEGSYGINHASFHYYKKKSKDLSKKEIKILIDSLKCPNFCNPNKIKLIS